MSTSDLQSSNVLLGVDSSAGLGTSSLGEWHNTSSAYGLEVGAGQHNPQASENLLEGKSFSVGGTLLIQGGDTSADEISEVNDLLARSFYDRDQVTAHRNYTNYRYSAGDSRTSLSVNESVGFDRGDSLTNPENVGTVVYRSSATIKGNIGFSGGGGGRDQNDYFRFNVGKAGDIKLSLSGLSRNAGLALYDAKDNLVTWSDRSGSASELISKNLGTGQYTARVYSYSGTWNQGATGYNLKIERQADALESFWENLLVDRSVENAALNSIKYENGLSRNDVIGIMESAGDYGSVTQTELTDLRNFYNRAINTQNIGKPLKVLSQKVLFSETSNQWYTGSDSIRASLGNLAAGSSTNHLNLLIGKHFLGTDRPAIHRNADNNLVGSYTRANGSLFVGGVSAADLNQGATGDCYFLAGLGGVAQDKSSMISDMFQSNGDGTWSVRFFTNGKEDYVTVDQMMATTSGGNYIYANRNQSVAGNNELWVALAEKAYAQVNESGRIGQDGNNFYGNGGDNGIGWGFSSAAIKHVSNLDTTSEGLTNRSFLGWSPGGLDRGELISLVNSNRVVNVSGFNDNATVSGLGPTEISSGVQRHVYVATGYNASTGRFSLQNPWGSQHLSLTFEQLMQLGARFTSSKS